MKLLVVLFALSLPLCTFGDRGAGTSSREDYFIDVADRLTDVSCDGCPGYVAKMMMARPMKIKDITDSKDIVVQTCQATLIAPNIIQTASHCLSRWSYHSWQEEAKGDCSKTFAFYFADGTKARCHRIISDSSFAVSKKHTRPDSVFIMIEPLEHLEVPEVTRKTTFSDGGQFTIWGSTRGDDVLEKRTCSLVERSVLAPLRAVGIRDSAFVTLTCDGRIEKGWSGAGVFYQGKLMGNVAQSLSSTAYHQAMFGDNEVIVSLAYCAHMDTNKVPRSCYQEEKTFDLAIHELYYRSLDFSLEWQNLVMGLFQNNFPHSQYRYNSLRNGTTIIQDRSFEVRCVSPKNLENQREVKIMAKAVPSVEHLRPRFVHFSQDTEVIGLYGVVEEEVGMGRFSIPLDFSFAVYSVDIEGLFLKDKKSNDDQLPEKIVFCPND